MTPAFAQWLLPQAPSHEEGCWLIASFAFALKQAWSKPQSANCTDVGKDEQVILFSGSINANPDWRQTVTVLASQT